MVDAEEEVLVLRLALSVALDAMHKAAVALRDRPADPEALAAAFDACALSLLRAVSQPDDPPPTMDNVIAFEERRRTK